MALTHERFRAHVQPWSGAIAGAVAWAAHQQLLANVLHYDCAYGNALSTTIAGALALAIIAAGALASWRARPREGVSPHDPPPARFVCDLSLLAAGLFALPVLMQTAAGWLVPSCVQ
ncbi:MAG TPA: hypothetical protein VFL14_09285 [Xanthomonadales bacterium]|nr:hypothetical protein [Xanthomonadales bacterium]